VGRRTYQVYGVTLGSTFDFAVPLVSTDDDVDVEFSVTGSPPVDVDLDTLPPVHGDAPTDVRRYIDEWFRYYQLDDVDVVRLRAHADYYLFDDRIVCHQLHPGNPEVLDNQLFGTVFALWLERRGTLALHASAAAVGGTAVGFIAASKGGKTSTACAMAQAGHPLLSEDLLPLRVDNHRYVADPGYPMVRMWPDQARWFTGEVEHHPLVHRDFDKRRVTVGEGGFASFQHDPLPLGGLYLLHRDPTVAVPEIRPVEGQAALIELLRTSFLPVEVERFGWQGRRLRAFASLLHEVPLRELRYPPGFERLPEVVATVVGDVRGDRAHDATSAGDASPSTA
jgi:hypothetical protein